MSKNQRPAGMDPDFASPRTPGSLGWKDAVDPDTPAWFLGDTPGSLGVNDGAAPGKAFRKPFSWHGHQLLASNAAELPAADSTEKEKIQLPAIVEGSAYIWSGAHGHPRAVEFFHTFPFEPIVPTGHFKVTSTVPINDMTISNLFEAILKHKSKDIMIVAHGHGGGLSVPLVHGIDEPLGLKAMGVFAGILPDSNLPLSKSALASFRAQLSRVQKMGLRLVVLRACTVGAFPDTLNKLKKFFNCEVVPAPAALDGYGKINVGAPTKDSSAWDNWLSQHPAAVVEFASPNRFAWTDSFPSLMSAAIAESDKAIQTWITSHLPRANRAVGHSFPYHALNAGEKVIFPGDQNYREYLQNSE